MTDRVNVSVDHPWDQVENARTFATTPRSEGFVMPGNANLLSDLDSALLNGTYGEFIYKSASGLDVTIESGEAVVNGLPVARDSETAVTLPDGSTTAVYLGWMTKKKDGLMIGTQADFDALSVDYEYMKLHTFTTQNGAVTDHVDERSVGPSLNLKNRRYEGSNPTAVAKAEQANSADSAQTAQSANEADVSDHVYDINLGGQQIGISWANEPPKPADGDINLWVRES